MNDDVGSVVQALAAHADAVLWLIQALAVMVGLWFLAQAGLRLVQLSRGGRGGGHGQQWGGAAPVGGVVIGSLLINFGVTVSSTVQSMFGDEVAYSSIISYSQQVDFGAGEWKMALKGLAALVAVFGAYAIFEGFLFWKKCADGQSGQDYFRKGLTHVVGGAAAVNIAGTITLLANTASVNLKAYF